MKGKKLIISLGLASLVAVSASVGALAADKIALIVNGKVSNADVKTINGTTYVPLRAAAELLGANVNYDSKSKTVTITSNGASTEVSDSYRTGDFVFTQLTVEKSVLGADINVDITNNGNQKYSGVLFTASFYDKNGKRIGTAQGSTSDIDKGDTKSERMISSSGEELLNYASVKFQIDGAY